VVVANRGEIAMRIIRAARELGWHAVALYARDEAGMPHTRLADVAVALPGEGPAAYLDAGAVLTAARDAGGAGALVHPGYGFLSEDSEFAIRCADAGVAFVGPSPKTLATCGDKIAARDAALAADIPVLGASGPLADLAQAREFFATHAGGIMLKAVSGGGGRGMRAVSRTEDLSGAYERCQSEVRAGFGDGAVFAEALYAGARHIEVQLIGDGGAVVAVGDRDCSVQRRHQKLIEIAPAQNLSGALRERLHAGALRLGEAVELRGLATVEFLVRDDDFVFLEVNPRIQVEHPVTELTTGLDLVSTQLKLFSGHDLAALGLAGGSVATHGVAIQCRVNAERLGAGVEVLPATGTLTGFVPPSGAGVRADAGVAPGTEITGRYDSLLVKVITQAADFPAAARKADGALAELVVDGVATNADFLRAVLTEPGFVSGVADTGYLEAHWDQLVKHAGHEALEPSGGNTGAPIMRAPLSGTVVSIPEPGADIAAGDEVAVIEAMKMEYVLTAPAALRVEQVLAAVGQQIPEGTPLVIHTPLNDGDIPLPAAEAANVPSTAVDHIRDDLAEVLARQERVLDAARPGAVAKMRALGRRTARENIADLVDEGSFVEYGALAFAAQRAHRSDDDLIASTPADGLIGGRARIAGAPVIVLSYDYTVLAGTQGVRNHAKTDRLLELAARESLPVVLFAEGGGGRPGDTDHAMASALGVTTFRHFGALSGQVPLIGIVSGRCFAGNAALLGICDVVIATPDATIGMGGPAMIEGGGLGMYRPEEVGPVEVQRRNGVIDIVADDEPHAVAVARRYLSYLNAPPAEWVAPDPLLARHVIPENRLRAYDIGAAITAIADQDSVLELRSDYGVGIVTAFMRVAGRAYGVVANNSHHLGGAIDAPAADKLAKFLRRCDAYGLPIVSLCDTPGFMVGPAAEATGTVRRFGDLFVTAAQLTVPYGVVILRKAYGLGAQAMAAGTFAAPRFVIAWPTGELGPMGLEGAVRLAMRKQLDAVEDPAARHEVFTQLVNLAYDNGKALSVAGLMEIDDVIDPADTRHWIQLLDKLNYAKWKHRDDRQ